MKLRVRSVTLLEAITDDGTRVYFDPQSGRGVAAGIRPSDFVELSDYTRAVEEPTDGAEHHDRPGAA